MKAHLGLALAQHGGAGQAAVKGVAAMKPVVGLADVVEQVGVFVGRQKVSPGHALFRGFETIPAFVVGVVALPFGFPKDPVGGGPVQVVYGNVDVFVVIPAGLLPANVELPFTAVKLVLKYGFCHCLFSLMKCGWRLVAGGWQPAPATSHQPPATIILIDTGNPVHIVIGVGDLGNYYFCGILATDCPSLYNVARMFYTFLIPDS